MVTFTKSNKLSQICANIILFPNRGRQRRHHVWRGTGGRQSQVRLCKLNSMIGWDDYKFERGRSLVAMRVNALKQLPTPWLLQCGVLLWGFKYRPSLNMPFCIQSLYLALLFDLLQGVMSVCLYVCLWFRFLYSVILTEYVVCHLYSLNGWTDFDETFHKSSDRYLQVSFFAVFQSFQHFYIQSFWLNMLWWNRGCVCMYVCVWQRYSPNG